MSNSLFIVFVLFLVTLCVCIGWTELIVRSKDDWEQDKNQEFP